jgi:hypothetical protein
MLKFLDAMHAKQKAREQCLKARKELPTASSVAHCDMMMKDEEGKERAEEQE